MRARDAREAVIEFVGQQQRLAACVTPQPMMAFGDRLAGRHGMDVRFTGSGAGAPLRLASGARLMLDVRLNFAVVVPDLRREELLPHSTAYSYRLLDALGAELVAYHWHPKGASPVTWPHLHLRRVEPLALGRGDRLMLSEAHLPTGIVSFASMVRLLIDDIGVAPRQATWREIVKTSEQGG